MRSSVIKIFLTVFCGFLAALNAEAQTCTGSLGDPVINETFGAATTPGIGPPLPAGITNYNYVNNQCPNDGQYTIATASNNCFGTWHNVSSDHTGDPGGYMMIVNASYQPGVFFTQRAEGSKLCPNTTYEFAAWIANMVTLNDNTKDLIKPNITFTITDSKGNPLAPPYQTGDIPEVSGAVAWKHYGTYFTTPSDGSDIIVTMTNNAPGGKGNDILLDDITFRPCGPVIQSGFGDALGDQLKTLCAGDDATFTLKASQQGYNAPRYQWQLNLNNTGWNNINGETNPALVKIFTNAVAGTYQYRVGILNGGSTSLACNIYSKPLTVQVYPLPAVTLPPVTQACEGEPLVLSTVSGDSYEWSGPGNFQSAQQNPVITNSVTAAIAGVYTVKVTSNGCPAIGSTTVNVSPAIVPVVNSDIPPICQGGTTQLTASGGLYYKWEPATGLDHDDIPNPVAGPLQTTTYKVTISNNACSDNTKSVTVNVRKNPVATVTPGETIFEGQSVKLQGRITGDNITVFYWTPAAYLDDPHSLTPTASPTSDITYTLNAVSETCGVSAASTFVRVYEKLNIPNTFSPNGDGINDKWDISKLITYPGCLITIYSRAGQQVFKSIGYGKPWDGTYKGSPLPVGTYYYVIDLNIGTPKISGWVMIVR